MDLWFSLKSSLISHLNHSNQIRNDQVMAKIRTLVKIEQGVPVQVGQKQPDPKLYRYSSNLYRHRFSKNDQNLNCTGTGPRCTGTGPPKMPRNGIFHHFSCTSLPYFSSISLLIKNQHEIPPKKLHKYF